MHEHTTRSSERTGYQQVGELDRIDGVTSWSYVESAPATSAAIERAADRDDPELSWQERSLCAQTDPEAFFPEKGGSTREAKKVCVSCDVRSQCLEYALEHDERFGIWGGLSERERRRLKKLAV